jgi:hypothetical protein
MFCKRKEISKNMTKEQNHLLNVAVEDAFQAVLGTKTPDTDAPMPATLQAQVMDWILRNRAPMFPVDLYRTLLVDCLDDTIFVFWEETWGEIAKLRSEPFLVSKEHNSDLTATADDDWTEEEI